MTVRLDQISSDSLRARAAHLRDLSRCIDHSLIMRLDDWAGEDTWQMPRADLCRQLLRTSQRQLGRCCESLLATARQLEQQAEALDSMSVLGAARVR